MFIKNYIIKILFCLLAILQFSCEKPPIPSQSPPNTTELTITTAAHQFIGSQTKFLSARYNMTLSGIGTSLNDGVRKLTWYFHIPKKLTKDEGRIIIMDCISQIVKNANNDPELKLFFNKAGFNHNNIELAIIVDLGKEDVFYPEFKAIGYSKGELGYYTDDPEKIVKIFYTKEYESYEDAKAILIAQGREDVLLQTDSVQQSIQ